jgi:hypothetical protein
MPPDGKTHNQIDHILVDIGRHSSVLGVSTFRGTDCHSDHYLAMTKVRERFSVSKWATKNFDMEKFNHEKINEVKGKEQRQDKISKMFAALKKLDDDVDINTDWETIRENIKISSKESLGYYELKQHKPWFDETCQNYQIKGKQAKLQWLQDPSQINGDDLNNVLREAGRDFRNKRIKYLKDKTNELATQKQEHYRPT